MTGTGTQADPFVVGTYAELANIVTNPDSLSECHVKIGNNIDISQEFPFGDMPVLNFGANVFVDGDNKTIANWFYTGAAAMITMSSKDGHPNTLKNLNFANIVYKATANQFIVVNASGSGSQVNSPLIENCTFVGMSFRPMFSIQWASPAASALRSCVFNILMKESAVFVYPTYYLPLESCNVKIVSEGTGSELLKTTGNSYIPHNCYFDISIPNASASAGNVLISNIAYDNCIIKISSPISTESANKARFGASVSGANVSIMNNSAASGIESQASAALVEVTDQNWHDIAYLQSIGFSAGVRS